uniref:Uncharacterized protein n=1 Tax=Anguilla anguilla TaxID=7936 RepID=A0A0E9QL52_ANGAN
MTLPLHISDAAGRFHVLSVTLKRGRVCLQQQSENTIPFQNVKKCYSWRGGFFKFSTLKIAR